MFHSGYGFNHEMPYGQYSPVATPLPSLMVDGQLYSPQQVPFSPSYYAQATAPSLPHMSSAIPISPADLMLPESSSIDTMLFGPGSGYLAGFGSFGGGNLSGNLGSSSLTSPAGYPQPMGILGSYEHNVGQVFFQLILNIIIEISYSKMTKIKPTNGVVILLGDYCCFFFFSP